MHSPLKFAVRRPLLWWKYLFQNEGLPAVGRFFHPVLKAKTFKTCEWCKHFVKVNAFCIFDTYVNVRWECFLYFSTDYCFTKTCNDKASDHKLNNWSLHQFYCFLSFTKQIYPEKFDCWTRFFDSSEKFINFVQCLLDEIVKDVAKMLNMHTLLTDCHGCICDNLKDVNCIRN